MSAEGLNDQRIKESPLTRNQSQNSIDENEHNYKEGSIARSEELEDLHSATASSNGEHSLRLEISDSEPVNNDNDSRKESSNSSVSSCTSGLDLLNISADESSVTENKDENTNKSEYNEDIYTFANYMKEHEVYSLIPTSSKIVIFDTRLPVKKAFFALVANGLRAAPLWDSDQGLFVGMLTISDFISILQTYYRSPMKRMHELEDHLIDTWRKLLLERKQAKPDERPPLSKNIGMVSISPDASLYEGLEILVRNKIHRLPIIDPDSGNALYILTHKRILRFLSFCFEDETKEGGPARPPMPSFMKKKLGDIQNEIGTYGNIHVVRPDTPVISALSLFVENRVSALPIVDEEGRIIDIYAKFDAINLAATRSYHNLDVTVQSALSHREQRPEGVTTCRLNETVETVAKRLVKAEVHRLVVVDDNRCPIGIISLSDLLSKIVLNPERLAR